MLKRPQETESLLEREWDEVRNLPLRFCDVSPGSHKRVWWRCERGHEWQAVVYVRAQDGTGCPYCAGKRVKAGENDLATLYPELAAEWSHERNGGLVPESFAAASNRRVWWRCALGHEWRAMIGTRTQLGCGCPYCAGRKVLAGFNDLASQQPKLAKQWHEELNGELKPCDITAGSSRRVWWKCEYGHVWRAAVYSRTGAKKCGCPVCAGNIKRTRTWENKDSGGYGA